MDHRASTAMPSGRAIEIATHATHATHWAIWKNSLIRVDRITLKISLFNRSGLQKQTLFMRCQGAGCTDGTGFTTQKLFYFFALAANRFPTASQSTTLKNAVK